ncbi:hypothetical protein [Leptospira sarikeiensis]|uniref:Glycosyltransferase RgtA/B/C/D-like domain-containing protein n=1 Tax=Leptospira sarikeiensis TaxID=2484943 RepID=A0A4R9JZR3_9LEPT|nr:hypothetical protein [Leptospira sarikeiensis]TGL58872.1 hypothetical protein EHQ64_17675 [Leptospira sarikeiensis]
MNKSEIYSKFENLIGYLHRLNVNIELWSPRSADIIIPIFVFIFGFFYNLHFALIGFQPLDGSIVFDGGWKILNGQIPFRDFSSPAGTTPSLIQAIFFLFGVGWIQYFAHSSFFNGLFGVISYIWFRKEGGNILLSGSLSFLSVLFFYPPVGFPFIETHSIFFSILMLLMASLAVREPRFIYIFGIFSAFLLGFLSKQIPITILALGVPILLIRVKSKDLKRILLYSAYSIIILTVAIFLINWILGIDWREEFFYLFQITFGTGQDRFSGIQAITQNQSSGSLSIKSAFVVLKFLFDFILVFDPHKYSVKLFYLLLISTGVILYYLKKKKDRFEVSEERIKSISQILLALLFFSSAVFYSAVSKNQPQIGFVQFFFFFAFICLSFSKSTRTPYYLILLILSFLITKEFHSNVNKTRMANDMMYVEPTEKIDLGYFEFKWRLPDIYEKRVSYSDYKSFTEFAKKNPENILYLGDMTAFLGLSGKRSYFPALWYHTDLSIPSSKFKTQHETFQKKVLENIRTYQIKYIVFEGSQDKFSEMTSLKDLEMIEEYISKNEKDRSKIGNLIIVRIF